MGEDLNQHLPGRALYAERGESPQQGDKLNFRRFKMFKDENQFWLGLWTIAAITIGIVIVSVLNYNIEQDKVVAQIPAVLYS